MAAESLEVRMAKLEGAYEQVDKRLGALDAGLRDLRAEMVAEFAAVRAEIGGVRAEIGGVRVEIGGVRAEMRQQFFWVVGIIVVSILIPIAFRFLPQ